jgi:hypothetical protein
MIFVLSIAGVLLSATVGTFVGLSLKDKNKGSNDGAYGNQNNNTNNDNENSKPPTFDEMCSQYNYLCSNLSQPVK